MQGFYPASFEREMGCTEAEWLGWLPRACGGAALEVASGHAIVLLPGGCATLDWRVLEPRRIALVVLPRLSVRFDFDGVDESERQRFMHHFDLATQRGGG